MRPGIIVAIAVAAPLVLAMEMVANCWAHNKTREMCDPDGQVPEMVQACYHRLCLDG